MHKDKRITTDTFMRCKIVILRENVTILKTFFYISLLYTLLFKSLGSVRCYAYQGGIYLIKKSVKIVIL